MMSSALGWINTGANLAGAVGSFIGSGSGSSAVGLQREAMDHQFELNQYSDWLNYQRTKEMADTQFERNKWFTQHQYRNAFDDLKAAGVNPLLGLPNGSSGSVGLPSVSGSSVGLLDPASAVGADVNKKKLAVDTALGITNTLSDVALKKSASAKAYADTDKAINEAGTELKKQELIDAQIKKTNAEADIIPYSNPYKTGVTAAKNIVKDIKAGKSVGDIVSEVLPPLPKTGSVDLGAVGNSASSLKSKASMALWKYYDLQNDLGSFVVDTLKGNRIPFKYYRGSSRDYRIKNGIYKFRGF